MKTFKAVVIVVLLLFLLTSCTKKEDYTVTGIPSQIDVYLGEKYDYNHLNIELQYEGAVLDPIIIFSIQDTSILEENDYDLEVSFYIDGELVHMESSIIHMIDEGLDYFTFDTQIGMITDYDASHGTEVMIPNTIKGIDVVSIGPGAFENKGLTSITLNEGLETINMYAFAGNDLSEILLVSSLQYVDEGAFENNDITHVTFQENIQYGYGVFAGNSIQEVSFVGENTVLPTQWKSLGLKAELYPGIILYNGMYFDPNSRMIIDYNDTASKDVLIPSSINDIQVLNIGPYAFKDKDIESLIIETGTQLIMYGAFTGNNIVELSLPETCLQVHSYTFSDNEITTITFYNNTLFGNSVFQGNDNITEVTIIGDPSPLLIQDWSTIGFPVSELPE